MHRKKSDTGSVLLIILILSGVMSLLGLQFFESVFLFKKGLSHLERAEYALLETFKPLETAEQWLKTHEVYFDLNTFYCISGCRIQKLPEKLELEEAQFFFEIECETLKTHVVLSKPFNSIGSMKRLSWLKRPTIK